MVFVAGLCALFLAFEFVVGLVESGVVAREEGPGYVGVVWLTLGFSDIAIAIGIPLSIGMRATYWRARLRTAQAVQPQSVRFLARRTPELVDARAEIGLPRRKIPRQFVVTVGADGIGLWFDRSTRQAASLSLASVQSVHPGMLHMSRGRILLKTRALFFDLAQPNGKLSVPLPPVGDRGLSFADARDCNQILDRLSRFLTVT